MYTLFHIYFFINTNSNFNTFLNLSRRLWINATDEFTDRILPFPRVIICTSRQLSTKTHVLAHINIIHIMYIDSRARVL